MLLILLTWGPSPHSQPEEVGLHIFLHGTTQLLVAIARVVHAFCGKTPWLTQPGKGVTVVWYGMEQARGHTGEEAYAASKFSQFSHHFRG